MLDNDEDISLPDGYEPYHEWILEHPEVSVMDEISDRVRWLNHEIAFVLDDTDEGYLGFMEKCRRDTGALKKELENELKRRDLPVTVKKAGSKRKMSFIIRGPFLSSTEKEKDQKRMQGKVVDRDNFILHFDAKERFQLARFWSPDEIEDLADFQRVYNFRAFIEHKIAEVKPFLDENYGNWPVIANRIVDIIDESLPILNS